MDIQWVAKLFETFASFITYNFVDFLQTDLTELAYVNESIVPFLFSHAVLIGLKRWKYVSREPLEMLE